MSEIFSDSARGKFPKSQAELSARLKSIESCINNDENLQEVSVEFCKSAFRLLADCLSINEENVRFLSSDEACESYDLELIKRLKMFGVIPCLKSTKKLPLPMRQGLFYLQS